MTDGTKIKWTDFILFIENEDNDNLALVVYNNSCVYIFIPILFVFEHHVFAIFMADCF